MTIMTTENNITAFTAVKGIHQTNLTFNAVGVGELILTYVGTGIVARRAIVLSVAEGNVVASSEAWPQLGTPTMGDATR